MVVTPASISSPPILLSGRRHIRYAPLNGKKGTMTSPHTAPLTPSPARSQKTRTMAAYPMEVTAKTSQRSRALTQWILPVGPSFVHEAGLSPDVAGTAAASSGNTRGARFRRIRSTRSL